MPACDVDYFCECYVDHDHCFRINRDWSFDDAMAEYGCEVHSFDPRFVMSVLCTIHQYYERLISKNLRQFSTSV